MIKSLSQIVYERFSVCYYLHARYLSRFYTAIWSCKDLRYNGLNVVYIDTANEKVDGSLFFN